LSILVQKLSPRYVYCATDLESSESETFLNERGCLTRCTSLANLLGSYKKPKESTAPYIKAIEISPEFNDEVQGIEPNKVIAEMLEKDENPFIACMMLKNELTQKLLEEKQN
jgi:hypothetical protein